MNEKSYPFRTDRRTDHFEKSIWIVHRKNIKLSNLFALHICLISVSLCVCVRGVCVCVCVLVMCETLDEWYGYGR